MKKLILALLAVTSITAADAQKNSILVYGSAGLNFDNNNSTKSNAPSITKPWTDVDVNTINYHIAPGIGYQFNRNMTVGLQGGYASVKTEWLENRTHMNMPLGKTSYENDEWNLGAFFRYTKYLSTLFSVYGQVNAGYVAGDIEMIEPGFDPVTGNARDIMTNGDYEGLQAEIFPAFAINVHKGWALNFGFGGIKYRNLSYEAGNMGINNTTTNQLNPFMDLRPDHSNSFAFTFGQQFNLTITKNIGCGKFSRRHRSGGGNMDASDDARRNSKDSKDDDEDDE
ncbi:MAG: hypothetical protein EOP56_10870 [Sphingobacteriales bacterium]|nr:MAG: hypothetical protein EOP56_10870 [Sphingobacteriales bacterium]